jgi:hypothetical protein
MKMDNSVIKLNKDLDSKPATASLTGGFTGIYVMNSYFNYLNTKFFSNVCNVSVNTYGGEIDYVGCQCNGFDFFGLPSLQIEYNIIGDETKYQFEFYASEYVLYPKIDN